MTWNYHTWKKISGKHTKTSHTRVVQDSPLTTCSEKILEYLARLLTIKKRKSTILFGRIHWPPDMDSTVKALAANHLFNLNDDGRKLMWERAWLLHHIVAKLPYLCRRVRQDIQSAVVLLFTRVKSTDEDEYKKLTRAIQYIWETINWTFTIKQMTILNGG